jgi:amidohydrolase
MSFNLKELENIITKTIDNLSGHFISISHQIHERPEIGNQEYFASKLLADTLEAEKFTVQRGIPGHETAFIARKRSEKPGAVIAYLAEYDALPNLGHACGHNIIGTASTAAAIALSKVLDEVGGEIVVFGTPAEEGGPNGSAKASFIRQGLLEGIDACMMIHPNAKTTITGSTLAVDPLDFEYLGKPAHAAACPEEGINALDAVILLFNGINALRQHVTDDVRIHGIITHGGDAPNIVPEYAKARFFIRAATRKNLDEVTIKVKAIAEGAALATCARLNVIAYQPPIDDFLMINSFDDIFKEHLEGLGFEVESEDITGLGSTDAGNISQVVPTIHPYISIGDISLAAHTVEFREAAKSEAGDNALLMGSKSLALTGLTLLSDKIKLQSIKEDFNRLKISSCI